MPVICRICDKVYATRSSHNRHVKEVHREVPNQISDSKEAIWSSRCLEQDCDDAFKNTKDLMDHLQRVHSLKFETQSLQMKNWNDWKSNIENTNHCYYVLKSKNSSTSGEIIYYNCNRTKTSYVHKDNDQRNSLQKSQGSCKMNNACTSQIKVKRENDKIVIEWQKVHYGHSFGLQHLRVQNSEKQIIASKLINGVTPKSILESTRDNIEEKNLKRIDLLKTKDIRNIQTSFGIEVKDGKRDANDAFSVDLWVQECESSKENPILFYKPQGKEHNILKKDDFCLIIMNKFQRQMIQKFQNIITVDGTHGLNSYNFEMTTIMVIDEFHHGFPVAEMFSNRKDTIVQTIFFRSVKETVGIVNCRIFMSDMAESFFNAWLLVMEGSSSQHLFCSWHVDRAWQSNLNKIANREKRSEIYKILKTLQQQTSESNFISALSNFIDYLCKDQETKTFGEYFKNTYSHNFKKWAYCFRKESSINTNMHVESMHKIIKYFYSERKTVKRLDKGLNAVLKFVRDKSVERIIKLTKGENTKQTRLLFESHKEAVKNSDNYLITGCNTYWKVTKKEHNISYTVHQLIDTKCCEQVCTICGVCIHMFSCDCKFFEERRTICKHIHIILSKQNSNKKSMSISDSKDNEASISQCLLALPQEPSHYIHKTHDFDRMRALFSKLENFNFEELDDSTISQIHHHLLIINSLIKCQKFNETNEFEIKNKGSKRIIDPQIRFKSTKRKRVDTVTSLKRPSRQEVVTIQENLEQTNESFICKSVLPSNDHHYYK